MKRAQASAQPRKEKASADQWCASYDKAVKAAKRDMHHIVDLYKARSLQTHPDQGKYTEAYFDSILVIGDCRYVWDVDYLKYTYIEDDASRPTFESTG